MVEPDRDAASGRTLERAQLAERSEARTYRSLVEGADLPGFTARTEGGVLRLLSPSAPSAVVLNRVLCWGVAQEPTEAALDLAMDPFIRAAQGFGIEIAEPVLSPACQSWLRARRLRRTSVSQVLTMDLGPGQDRFGDGLADTDGLRIEQVGDDGADSLARLCRENFGVSEEVGRLLARGTRGPRWRRWLALDGLQPVGASLSFVDDGVAWFGWTSVSPSHRGRRLYDRFIARQLDDAVESGCHCVTTDTARSTPERPDAAYKNLRRIGFEDAYLRPTYVWAAPRRT